MEFRMLATLATVLSLPFGLAFLLAPSASAAMYGVVEQGAGAILVARYLGAEVLMYAAATWALRDLHDGAAQRRAAAVLTLMTACGLGVSIRRAAAGTMNALGWSSVAL